jgi:hypothetical protein
MVQVRTGLLHALLALILFCGVQGAIGQNIIDERTATVVSYWNVGDSKTFRLDRVKAGNKNSSANMMLDLRVIDATDSTYDVEVRYRDMQVQGELPPDPRSAEAVMSVMKSVDGLRVVARTSDTGIFHEVVNQQEVAAHCEKILKGILDLAATDDERTMMEAAFGKLITPESLSITAAEDINYLLFPFGIEYTLNKKERGDTELPNPLGGDPIPGVLEVTMVELDVAKEHARISATQHLDPAGLSRSAIALMKSLGTDMDAKDKREFERIMREMDVSDTYEFDVDLTGAWVTKAICIRTIEVQGLTQTDSRTYTVQ